MTSPSVVWFRRDLRIDDNPALAAAVADGPVVPLFVLDDRLRAPSGPNRVAFLYGCLRQLDGSLGGRLVLRTGRPAEVVRALAQEVGATAVHAAADFGPYGRRRDEEVERELDAAGIELVRTGSPYAIEPGSLVTKTGTPFRVFSPFYRAWKARGAATAAAPALDPATIEVVDRPPSESIPDDPAGASPNLPVPGEAAGRERLRRALVGADGYEAVRNDPAADGTTRLSPYLKYGCVHPRQVLAGLGRSTSHERLRMELAWREFYADVLWHHPESAREPLQEHMAAMRTDRGPEADERFAAWAAGRTGYPIVDAGMRQLVAEGWMHNRVRMIVASFLVKDLHLDWQRGARHFLHHLVDGDLASNNHGWQWVAGTGTDPAPSFRVFNPVLQGEKFDPDGVYVRRYVPELAGIDIRFVHHPWDGPPDLFIDDPAPIVDHAAERGEALRRYAEVKR
ncbi:MAG TPA: deoxyribodipyrimidine photo-lyase [Acidimicrobiales bacterium]|nr:deoxyribodipyrimidine photo-lyase [Acidimicrobiales bacterium]